MGLVRSSSFPLPPEDALRREMQGRDVEGTQWVRGRSAARASRCQFTPRGGDTGEPRKGWGSGAMAYLTVPAAAVGLERS